MSDLRELYQAVIIDHSRRPRNFGADAQANRIKEGYNPLCGDQLMVYVHEQDGVIDSLQFEGSGCAISMASASLMTEALKGKTVVEAQKCFDDFHLLVTKADDEVLMERMGKLSVLAGVTEFPMRVKCATLAWHTLMAALKEDKDLVSTE